MTIPRALTAFGLAALLAACGSAPVRNGPQAVHPGTSPLARGQYFAPTDHYVICDTNPQQLCYKATPGDGATPIID